MAAGCQCRVGLVAHDIGAGQHRRIVLASEVQLDGGIADRAVAQLDGVCERVRVLLTGGQLVDVDTFSELEFDLAVDDADLVSVACRFPSRGGVSEQQVGERALSVVDGEQSLGVASEVVRHDVEQDAAGAAQLREIAVLIVAVHVIARLRRFGEGNGAHSHEKLLERLKKGHAKISICRASNFTATPCVCPMHS